MLKPFLCVKNLYKCNIECWYCSTNGNEVMSNDDVISLYRKYDPGEMLLIGGEPLFLTPEYYMKILDSGCKFSIQSNLTLYNNEWDKVFTHKNFTGLSVSGDKFKDFDEFYKVYSKVSEVIYNPPVLILLTDDYERSYNKAFFWIEKSQKYSIPIKINIIKPVGRAKKHVDKLLRISEGYNIYSHVLDEIDDLDLISPFNDIIHSLKNGGISICPFCTGNCLKNKSIITIEPNMNEYHCPVLGDLKEGYYNDISYSTNECLYCEYFKLCQSCLERRWTVNYEKDLNYCKEAKNMWRKLYKRCQA